VSWAIDQLQSINRYGSLSSVYQLESWNKTLDPLELSLAQRLIGLSIFPFALALPDYCSLPP
jgi:hypothetical protein